MLQHLLQLAAWNYLRTMNLNERSNIHYISLYLSIPPPPIDEYRFEILMHMYIQLQGGV